MRLRKNTLFSLIALLIVLTFSAAGLMYAEIIFRTVIAEPNRGELIDSTLFPYHPYLISTQPPNLVLGNSKSILEGYFSHGPCDAAGNVTAKFNSEGFRSPEFQEKGTKNESAIRVLIVGGSASISWNISEACTLDQVLRTSLQDQIPGKNIEVYNVGSAAWKSFQELSAIQLYGSQIEPDIIVHFSGFNDINHAATMPINYGYSEGMTRHAFDRYVSWVETSVLNFFQEFRVGHYLRNLFVSRLDINSGGDAKNELPVLAINPGPTRVGTLVRFPINYGSIKERTDFDPYINDVVENFVRQEKFLLGAAQVLGAQLITVLQPTLYFKQPLSDVEDRLVKTTYSSLLNFTVQGYQRLEIELKNLAAAHDDHDFMNLSRVFNGSSETFFGDPVHFSAKGYDIVGKMIANEVKIAIMTKHEK